MRYLLLAILTPLISFVLFLWLSAIHDVVDKGKAYGFLIGMSKKTALESLRGSSDLKIDTINLVKEDRSTERALTLSKTSKFYDANKWVVMYDSSFCFDSVTLEFCDEELCKIYRKRQFCEVP